MTSPFGVDGQGRILTEVSPAKIGSRFAPLVESVRNEVLRDFQAELHSMYVYGSVPAGRAKIGISDLDVILVFRKPPDDSSLARVATLAGMLSDQYRNLVREIGLETTHVADCTAPSEYFGAMCFLKHLCVCIFGVDLARDVPSFKPSKRVARGFNGDLPEALAKWDRQLARPCDENQANNLSRKIGRKIVRTGFSLVMPRLKSWTTNLDRSAQAFNTCYPDHAADMKLALEWAVRGTTDLSAVLQFIRTFGKWLAQEFEVQIIIET